MQQLFKNYKTDILIVIGFAIFSLIYCFPQLQGKKLMQNDGNHWKGMAREAMAYHDSTGKDALWSNSMFGGMPTYTTYVGAANVNYPGYIQVVIQLLGKPAFFLFLAMLGFFIFLRVLGINKWLSIVGALAYTFASYNAIIITEGHDTKMWTIGYMPIALAGFYLIYQEKWLNGAALLGISIALIVGNNHFQMMYYMFIIFLCFAVCMFCIAIKEGKTRHFLISSVIAGIAGAIGLTPNITSVLTTNEYTKETMRGGASELSGHDKGKANGGLDKDYAFRWSSGIGETFCMMIPYLYGGATYDNAEMAPKTLEAVGGNAEFLPIYWGNQPSQRGPVFFGAVVCFLFVLGFMVIRSPHKWWILSACIIGTVLAWGKNLESVNYFLFDHVPFLNKFRTVEMALVIPQFLFPLLGIWAVQDIIDAKENPELIWKKVKIAAGITAGLCILVGVGASMFTNFSSPADARLQPEIVKFLKEDRAHLAAVSGLKSAIYILVAAGLLWAFLKHKIKTTMFISGLGLIIAIDLLPVAHNYLSEKNFVDGSEYDAQFEPRSVDSQILRDPDPYYRVLDLSRDPFNDAVQAYFHKCVGGYHPAKMEIYQDLIERQLGRGLNHEVLNMLNTKYIIFGNEKRAPGLMPNPAACGNAWFVDEVKWANTADEEMNGLNAQAIQDTIPMPNSFNPRKTAVMRANFKDYLGNYAFGKDSAAFVKLDKYGLDDISFKSNNSKDGLAVFSDIYYAKGWKAYVDGKETPIMKADYVLRAVKIPAGPHKIEFRFRPSSFYNGQKVAFVGSILIIGLCVTAIYRGMKSYSYK